MYYEAKEVNSMSKYTTGELAKICGISVRTVQFYDSKGLLSPSELTEGGRRLYSEEDKNQMQLICFLKALGLSLDSIKEILQSENPQKILLLILDEHEKQLKSEMEEKKKQLTAIDAVRGYVSQKQAIPENIKSDIEQIMYENKQKKLHSLHMKMLFWGSLCTIAEVISILVWIFYKNWIPFAIVMPVAILIYILLAGMYYKNSAYICPECGATFKPGIMEFFFSNHTPKTRKLTCKACGKKGWCVETYNE